MKKIKLLGTLLVFLTLASLAVEYYFDHRPDNSKGEISNIKTSQKCLKSAHEVNRSAHLINDSHETTLEKKVNSETSNHICFEDEYSTDLILALLMELPNNPKRRELLQNVQQLNEVQQEEIVYLLTKSERELDQESAVDLAIKLKSESVRHRAIRELLESSISDDVKLILSHELNTSLPSHAFDLAISTYFETQSVKIRTALIDSIFSSPDSLSLSMEEVFLAVRSAPSGSVTQRLEPLFEWLKHEHEALSESQKKSIALFSDDLFFETNNLEQKKIALLIRQLVSSEE